MAITVKIPSSKFPSSNHLRIRTIPQVASPSFIPISQISPSQATSKAPLNSLQKSTTLSENTKYKIEATLPTMTEILESSKAQNLDLQLQTLGPFFRITAKSLETQKELGKAEGLIRVWLRGRILHLDSIRLRRETLGMEKSIFGIGLFIGAVAVRYGYDCGCKTAELLAINDSDLYHSKLVRFYTRIGFKAVHEVTGTTFGDYGHMLVWGGIGTRMDANVEELLIRWCTRFKSRK
ncbi:hypothetical protein F2P56_036786 [Juglans regia]|uniref:Uncharacterized protein n=2 Tax=Juglans regia TaxID=51240 RepID=A0A833U586_JUGRE|nr:uncharacterized protein LOC109021669 [Juglans regia]KAF5444300.1 hypothetical protein F2P56_036786 [Juglans regia]